MGTANSKTPAPTASLRPREIILGYQTIPKKPRRKSWPHNRRFRQLDGMESREVPRDTRATLRCCYPNTYLPNQRSFATSLGVSLTAGVQAQFIDGQQY